MNTKFLLLFSILFLSKILFKCSRCYYEMFMVKSLMFNRCHIHLHRNCFSLKTLAAIAGELGDS